MEAELHRSRAIQFGLTQVDQAPIGCNNKLVNVMRDCAIWAVQNCEDVSAALDAGRPFNVLVGFKPSRFHVGHITLAREIAKYINLGGNLIFVVAAYEAGRRLTQEDAEQAVRRFWSIVKRTQLVDADPPIAVFCDQTSPELHELEDRFASLITVNRLFGLYGWDGTTSMGMMRIPCLTAAAFLLPQHIHPDRPTIVPLDVNQVTHAEVTKLIAKGARTPAPMFTYRSLIPSLSSEHGRMSIKSPKSAIYLDETREQVERKLRRSRSGGRTTENEQREMGGDLNRCSFFRVAELLLTGLDLDDMISNCVSGSSSCAQCKARFSTTVAVSIESVLAQK